MNSETKNSEIEVVESRAEIKAINRYDNVADMTITANEVTFTKVEKIDISQFGYIAPGDTAEIQTKTTLGYKEIRNLAAAMDALVMGNRRLEREIGEVFNGKEDGLNPAAVTIDDPAWLFDRKPTKEKIVKKPGIIR